MGRRLIVWSVENFCTALVMGCVLVVLGGLSRTGPDDIPNDFVLAASATLILFMLESGYLITVAFFGIILRGKVGRWYPLIAAGLFFIHLQFRLSNWNLHLKLSFQASGACTAFLCAYAGGWCLKRWTR